MRSQVSQVWATDDWIPPEVFFGTIIQGGRHIVENSGEGRLMFAVLADAIRICHNAAVYVTGTTRQQLLLAETRAWIASRNTSWPFAFENICAALDFDADNIRVGLARVQAARVTVPAIWRFRRGVGHHIEMPRYRVHGKKCLS